jgi:hypothetical protein
VARLDSRNRMLPDYQRASLPASKPSPMQRRLEPGKAKGQKKRRGGRRFKPPLRVGRTDPGTRSCRIIQFSGCIGTTLSEVSRGRNSR